MVLTKKSDKTKKDDGQKDISEENSVTSDQDKHVGARSDVDDNQKTEYHEVLYSKGTGPSKGASGSDQDVYRQKSWESRRTIEKQVDTIESRTKRKKSRYLLKKGGGRDIDTKVDVLLVKKKGTIPGVEHIETPDGYERRVHKKTGLIYFKKKHEP